MPKHSRLKIILFGGKIIPSKNKLGPERIAPEWWIDNIGEVGCVIIGRYDVMMENFYGYFMLMRAQLPGGWFCHGKFG